MAPNIILLNPPFVKKHTGKSSYLGFENVLGEKLAYSLVFYKRESPNFEEENINEHLSKHGFIQIPLIIIPQRKDLETEVCNSYAAMPYEKYFVLDEESKKIELVEFGEDITHLEGKNYHIADKNKLFSRMKGFNNRIEKWIHTIDDIFENYSKHVKNCKK